MKIPKTPLVSMRLMLIALVATCVGPLLLLAIGVAFYHGNVGPLALAMAGVVACTLMLAWRLATWISRALEDLSIAVRAAGDAPIELPQPHFLEELHLGQAFIYATTQLQDAHKALRHEEACLRTVLDTARDAIVVADDEGRIILFNRAAERMFGIDEQNALGSKLDRLIPPRYRGAHFAQMQEMAPGVPKPRHMGPTRVVWGLHADGRMFPMAASISCGVDGNRRYYTSIIRELVDAPVLQTETMSAK